MRRRWLDVLCVCIHLLWAVWVCDVCGGVYGMGLCMCSELCRCYCKDGGYLMSVICVYVCAVGYGMCLWCMWHVRCVYNVCNGCVCVSCMWDLSPISTPYAPSIFRTHCKVSGLTLAPTNEKQRISAKTFNSEARWQLAQLSVLGCAGSKGHTARLHAIPSITFRGQYSYLHSDETIKTHECLAPYPRVWSGQNLKKIPEGDSKPLLCLPPSHDHSWVDKPGQNLTQYSRLLD